MRAVCCARSHASMLTNVPVTPDALKTDAALVALIVAAGTILSVLVVLLVVVLADEVLELVLDDAAVEVVEDGGGGEKTVLPGPKPIAEAKVPPTVTVSDVSLAVMTSLPWLLRDALTYALPGVFALIAPIKSATVLVAVDVNVVVFAPALTVIVLFGGILSVESGVLPVSGTVPIAVA